MSGGLGSSPGDGPDTRASLRPTLSGQQPLSSVGPLSVTPAAAVQYAKKARLAKRARVVEAACSDALVTAWLASRTVAPSPATTSPAERFAALRARVRAKEASAGGSANNPLGSNAGQLSSP